MSSDRGAPATVGPCQNEAPAVPLARACLPWQPRPHAQSTALRLQDRLPEAARLCDSETVRGPVVEFSGSGPSLEEKRPYFLSPVVDRIFRG